MRKTFLILLLLICVFTDGKAQQVVTSGGFSEKQGLTVEWIIGGKLYGYDIYVVKESPGLKSAQIRDSIPEFSVKVYPTYTRDYVTVEITTRSNPEFYLELYNSIGEKVLERIIMKQPSIQVKMIDLTAGIYFLKVFKPVTEQVIHHFRIIKL